MDAANNTDFFSSQGKQNTSTPMSEIGSCHTRNQAPDCLLNTYLLKVKNDMSLLSAAWPAEGLCIAIKVAIFSPKIEPKMAEKGQK